MYIPYQNIQYYNNSLLFVGDNPTDVVKGAILEETVSAGRDLITESAGKAIGGGSVFGIIFTLLGIVNEYYDALEESEQKINHPKAQQKATDMKTGLIVVVKQTTTQKWVMDVTNMQGGVSYASYDFKDSRVL